MTTNRVWFVSSGEYSSYGVDHVFAARSDAETYAATSGRFVEGDDEGFPVIHHLPEPVEHLTSYVVIGPEAVVLREREDSSRVYPGIDTVPTFEARGPEVWFGYSLFRPPPIGATPDLFPQVTFVVEGTDVERVRKVVSEMKARCIAEFDLLIAAEAQQQKPRVNW